MTTEVVLVCTNCEWWDRVPLEGARVHTYCSCEKCGEHAVNFLNELEEFVIEMKEKVNK
jgi:hypothetical protein